jgi:hypothetical protein
MNTQEMIDKQHEKERLADTSYLLQKLKEFLDSEAYSLSAPDNPLVIRYAVVSIDANAAYLADPTAIFVERIWSGWEQFVVMRMVVSAVIHKHGITSIANLTYRCVRNGRAEFTFDYERNS